MFVTVPSDCVLRSQVVCATAEQVLDLQRRAARLRHAAATGVNNTSSRSHCVFTVGGSGVDCFPELHYSPDLPRPLSFSVSADQAPGEHEPRPGPGAAAWRQTSTATAASPPAYIPAFAC
jgi:hypothetical protein